VRSVLQKGPTTIDQLLNELTETGDGSMSSPTTEHLVLAITLLYTIKQANMDEDGRLVTSV